MLPNSISRRGDVTFEDSPSPLMYIELHCSPHSSPPGGIMRHMVRNIVHVMSSAGIQVDRYVVSSSAWRPKNRIVHLFVTFWSSSLNSGIVIGR